VTGMRLGRRRGGDSSQSVEIGSTRIAARASDASSHARFAAENARTGRLGDRGAVDRGSTRTALGLVYMGFRGLNLGWFPRNGLRQRLKLEVRRQAKLHLVGSFGKRGRGPNLGTVGSLAQGESVCSCRKA
jgi:hypothetical protein